MHRLRPKIRHGTKKFVELFKERTGEIYFFAIRQWIPPVRPPTGLAIYRPPCILRKYRDNLPAAQVTTTPMEGTLIEKNHPPFKAAIRTPGRWRNLDISVERKIFLLDNKRRFTVLARFRLGIHMPLFITPPPPGSTVRSRRSRGGRGHRRFRIR
jgi:hypothetical protein